ncbi:MAG: methyltransferase domain-containing protein [Hahellaceae bacterium]|nr:methyltransferase domain-containing protein [Hahellaceae bacterium]MCP5168978.1 methyltransferase domain-containing protein [Hahellaceae bacterium]
MTPEQAARLCCPLCKAALVLNQANPAQARQQQLVCVHRHSFDVARQGYVNLHPVQYKQSKAPGDSKEMIDARQAFLQAGHYTPIAARLTELVQSYLAPRKTPDVPCVFDAGCGEGYYLDYLVSHLPDHAVSATGLDISKPAILAAARRTREINWVVGTNARPPLWPGQVDVLMCLFGFPVWEAFRSLLSDNGVVILVDAGPAHLLELREVIYPEVRQREVPSLEKAQAQGLKLIHSETLRFRTEALDQPTLQNLLLMTPHLFRATQEGKAAAARLSDFSVSVEAVFRVLAPHSPV